MGGFLILAIFSQKAKHGKSERFLTPKNPDFVLVRYKKVILKTLFTSRKKWFFRRTFFSNPCEYAHYRQKWRFLHFPQKMHLQTFGPSYREIFACLFSNFRGVPFFRVLPTRELRRSYILLLKKQCFFSFFNKNKTKNASKRAAF